MLGDAPDFDPTAKPKPSDADAAAAPATAAGDAAVATAEVLTLVFCGHGTSQPDKKKSSGESQALVLHESEVR